MDPSFTNGLYRSYIGGIAAVLAIIIGTTLLVEWVFGHIHIAISWGH